VAGQGVGWLLVAAGVGWLLAGDLAGGIWFAFIGWFLVQAARSSYQELQLQQLLRGVEAEDVMADAHTLADMVRTDRHQLRPIAGDSAQAIKVVARAHKTLLWERTRHTLRLRVALREFFPAALEAFGELTGAPLMFPLS
jgi:hypothetical protein